MSSHVIGGWIFASCCVLAIGYGNAGPNQGEIEKMARKEVAVTLANRGASALVVNCILNPPAFSNYCIEAMRAENSAGK